MVLLIVSTLIMSAITGGHGFQRRGLLLGTRGTDPTRIVEHCVLRTRWNRLLALRLKIAMIDLVLIFIAGNVGLSFCGHLRKK
jgi:hypothetical protein